MRAGIRRRRRTTKIIRGDCLEELAGLKANSIDACVVDPPYGLEFMGKEWDAPWQVSSSSALFGKRKTKMPGWGVTRNPTYKRCGGRLRGAKSCSCSAPTWDEAPTATRLRQMRGFQSWCQDWAREVFRVLKPGGHLLSFGGTRTYHRMAYAIEDAGFEIRDTIMWVYGSGFPKSLDVSKAIDKAAGAKREVIGRKADPRYRSPADAASGSPMGNISPRVNGGRNYARAGFVTAPATAAARQWSGFGTALKPACEPIVLARKPLSESTVAANVLKWGTGSLNIDGCRVAASTDDAEARASRNGSTSRGQVAVNCYGDFNGNGQRTNIPLGRWPANVIHDGSDDVVRLFPAKAGAVSPVRGTERSRPAKNVYGEYGRTAGAFHGDEGSAARFFYCAKASKAERAGSKHPTVKPLKLMRHLVRLVTPPGGIVLDCFAGSGATGQAARAEGFSSILIERERAYVRDIKRRLAA